jgi:hypothetical protein
VSVVDALSRADRLAWNAEMKSPVSVTLIVMGTLLILGPIGADYLYQANLVSLLAKGQPVAATVIDHVSLWYRIVCWLTGSMMILIGMVAGAADRRASQYEAMAQEPEEQEEPDTQG